MNEITYRYKESLARKERLLKPYHEKKKFEDLAINEHAAMLILEAEIRLIKEFLEDLKYFNVNESVQSSEGAKE